MTAHSRSNLIAQFKTLNAGEAFKPENSERVFNKNERYYLKVSGLPINEWSQVLDQYVQFNSRIYLMAVPCMGGRNPDYSGLDFCYEASSKIVDSLKSMNV